MARDKFKTSQSKTNLYRKCREAYWLRYIEKLRRRRVARPLVFGRIVHEMIECYANGLNPMKQLDRIAKRDEKMFRSQREELEGIVGDTRYIMTEYFEYWGQPGPRKLEYIEMKGKSSEHSFEVEVDKDIVAAGKIDAFAKANKLRWLVEHKSGRQQLTDDHRWRTLQPSLYFRIVEILGLKPVDGMLWDFIRSKGPTKPQVLKTGKLSARGLDTLPSVVRDALREAKVSEKSPKYAPLMKQAMDNRSKYFSRIFTPIKKPVVDMMFSDFIKTNREMMDNHGKESSRTMSIGRHCDWCEFEPVCRAKLQGLDVGFVKKKEFEKRPPHENEEPDFEA